MTTTREYYDNKRKLISKLASEGRINPETDKFARQIVSIEEGLCHAFSPNSMEREMGRSYAETAFSILSSAMKDRFTFSIAKYSARMQEIKSYLARVNERLCELREWREIFSA